MRVKNALQHTEKSHLNIDEYIRGAYNEKYKVTF